MLNSSKNGLLIFDNFRVDHNLPKYINRKKHMSGSSGLSEDSVGGSFINMDDISMPTAVGGRFISSSDFNNDGVNEGREKTFYEKIKSFLKKGNKEKKPTMTITDFFKAVKASSINIEKYADRSNDYLNALKYAKQLNQDALVEQLQLKVNEAKYESMLYAGGFTTIITEEQVVKFYKECKKGLELTWIRNFTRVIPEKASEKKNEADNLLVFDNFCILHFDPDKKAFVEEKDPILFGVINGIRKLYYIADWVDEYCDLTLDQFIEKFGQEAISANDITVNYKLK